jgi:hypothetical protein
VRTEGALYPILRARDETRTSRILLFGAIRVPVPTPTVEPILQSEAANAKKASETIISGVLRMRLAPIDSVVGMGRGSHPHPPRRQQKNTISLTDKPIMADPGRCLCKEKLPVTSYEAGCEIKCGSPYIGERFGENSVGGKWLLGALLRISLTLTGRGKGAVGG